MLCKRCGCQLIDEDKFCRECGTPVSFVSKKKKIGVTVAILSATFFMLLFISVFTMYIIPYINNNRAQECYNRAQEYYRQGDLVTAAKLLSSIEDYNDSLQLSADYYFEAGLFNEASIQYEKLKYNSKENEYRYAVCLFERGLYKSAVSAFRNIENYADANEYLVKSQIKIISEANVNDIVVFGAYEQDNDIYNGKEEIQWIVVAKDENKVLLWTDKILDYQQFNNIERTSGLSADEPYISWEHSYIRKWLNSTFYNTAFSVEQKYIVSTTRETTDCNKYIYSTEEKVFLFSSEEFKKLKGITMNQRETNYATAKRKSEKCWNSCYTRDQEEYHGLFDLSNVYSPGVIDSHNRVYFMSSSSEVGAIRPCIWIDCADAK